VRLLAARRPPHACCSLPSVPAHAADAEHRCFLAAGRLWPSELESSLPGARS
jgi:hypothetical protein